MRDGLDGGHRRGSPRYSYKTGSKEWLANKELKRDVKLTVGDGSPKLFAYDQREIEILAKTRRTNPTLVEMERVISERVEVLRAVVTWLQNTQETIVGKV